MAKLTLENGVTIEGTPEEIFEMTAKFGVKQAEEVPETFAKGDRVKIVDASVGVYHDLYDGDVGIVTNTYGSFADEGKPFKVETDDDYDHFPASALRKVAEKSIGKSAETITHNGVEYMPVNRKAQAGDVVAVSHENGSCFKPHKIYGPCFESYGVGGLSVKADSSTGREAHEVASVYNEFYGRTVETVHVYEPKAEALKVGDYAVLISAAYRTLHGFSDGEIVEVIQNKYGEDDDDYRVKNITGEHTGYVKKSAEFVRKATDAEVAEASAQAVFTRLGRNPGEYKKGDIVRAEQTIRNNDGFARNIGEIEDVAKSMVGIRYGNGDYCGAYTTGGNVQLIAPVESRVDAS